MAPGTLLGPAAARCPAPRREHLVGPAIGVFLAAIYGGYFGGGLGIIVLAVLGMVLVDTLTRINALKQCTSLVVNGFAAVIFLFSGHVLWMTAGVMLVCALLGGYVRRLGA